MASRLSLVVLMAGSFALAGALLAPIDKCSGQGWSASRVAPVDPCPRTDEESAKPKPPMMAPEAR